MLLVGVISHVRGLGIVGLIGERGNVIGSLGLQVEGDQSVCHQVVDVVESLFADVVLVVEVELEILRDAIEPSRREGTFFCFCFSTENNS